MTEITEIDSFNRSRVNGALRHGEVIRVEIMDEDGEVFCLTGEAAEEIQRVYNLVNGSTF